jgi:hypothetical protein
MRGSIGLLVLSLLAACPSSGGEDESGASEQDDNGGCAPDAEPCRFLCCTDGASCVDGSCRFPNDEAELHVYVCPTSSGCTPPNHFMLDDTCSAAEGIVPGACVGTGLMVSAGSSYGFSTCQSCGGDCGSPSSLLTPGAGFATTRYTPGITLFCGGEECEPPPECGGVGSSSSSGGSSGSGSGNGGMSGGPTTGNAGAGEPTVCSETAFPTEFDFCVAIPGCSGCTIEVCSAVYSDGSCCAGYRTTDTLSFWPCTDSMCSMDSELCAGNAQEALRHCGCAEPMP